MNKRRRSTGPRVQLTVVAPAPANQAYALEGSLQSVSLATVLAVFDHERRTGKVIMRGPSSDGAAGEVLIRDGQPVQAWVRARVPGGGALLPAVRGREALYHLLGWLEGRFAFVAEPVEVTDELESSTTHLLLEAARRLDEQGPQDRCWPSPALALGSAD